MQSVDPDARTTDETILGDMGNTGHTRVKPRQTIRHGNPVNVTEYHFHKDVNIYGGVSSVNIKDNIVRNNRDSVLSNIEIITRQKSTHTQKNVHEKRDNSKDSQSFTTPSSSTAINTGETPRNDSNSRLKRWDEIRGQKRVSQVHLREDNASLNNSDSGFRYPGVTLSDPGVATRVSAPQDLADIEEEAYTEPQRPPGVSSFRQGHRSSAVSFVTDGSPAIQVCDTPDNAHCDASLQTDYSNNQPEEADSSSSSFSALPLHPFPRVPSPYLSQPNRRSYSLSHSISSRANSSSRSCTVYRTSSPSSRVDASPAQEPLSIPGANYPPDDVDQPIPPSYTEPVHYQQSSTPVALGTMAFPAPIFMPISKNTIPPAVLTGHDFFPPVPKSPNTMLAPPVSDNNHQNLNFPDQTTYSFPVPTNSSVAPIFNLPCPELYQDTTSRYYQEPDHNPVLVSTTGAHGQGNPSSVWYGDAKQLPLEHRQDNIQWNPPMDMRGGSHYNGRRNTSWP